MAVAIYQLPFWNCIASLAYPFGKTLRENGQSANAVQATLSWNLHGNALFSLRLLSPAKVRHCNLVRTSCECTKNTPKGKCEELRASKLRHIVVQRNAKGNCVWTPFEAVRGLLVKEGREGWPPRGNKEGEILPFHFSIPFLAPLPFLFHFLVDELWHETVRLALHAGHNRVPVPPRAPNRGCSGRVVVVRAPTTWRHRCAHS